MDVVSARLYVVCKGALVRKQSAQYEMPLTFQQFRAYKAVRYIRGCRCQPALEVPRRFVAVHAARYDQAFWFSAKPEVSALEAHDLPMSRVLLWASIILAAAATRAWNTGENSSLLVDKLSTAHFD